MKQRRRSPFSNSLLGDRAVGADTVFIDKKAWGQSPDGPVELYTLRNGGMELRVATLGATVVGLRVPCSGCASHGAANHGVVKAAAAKTGVAKAAAAKTGVAKAGVAKAGVAKAGVVNHAVANHAVAKAAVANAPAVGQANVRPDRRGNGTGADRTRPAGTGAVARHAKSSAGETVAAEPMPTAATRRRPDAAQRPPDPQPHHADGLDVVLGYDSLEQYLRDQCYLGCIVGRVANRISGASFELDGRRYSLDRNAGRHHLHGGSGGLHRRVWRAEAAQTPKGPALRLEVLSPDGDMGYPGEVRMVAVYTLLACGLRLDLTYSADRPTPVNPASHMYFNLSGPGTTCLDHALRINASHALEVDAESIPTGRLLPVADTPLDFRTGRPVGEGVDAAHAWTRTGQGYDQYFVLDRTALDRTVFDGAVLDKAGLDPVDLDPVDLDTGALSRVAFDGVSLMDNALDPAADADRGERAHGSLRPAARVSSPQTGLHMEVWTESPGLQLYSGNYIPEGLRGRGGLKYPRRAGLCLECHGFVDAPNRPEFPGVTVAPGRVYTKRTEYRFSWE